MQAFSERHRRWVANHFGGKIKELHYHLTAIVVACDQSLRLSSSGLHVPSENSEAVVFGFSAFANTIQTLKDAAKTVTGEQLPWSQIEQLRHGAFMRNARNATTHDGHPVVSAWVDGRYFVPARIVRLGDREQIIEIAAPTEDIRTLCLEFSQDFCQMLREILSRTENVAPLRGIPFDMAELDEAIAESNVMPEFVKQMFAANRQEIAKSLDTIRHDPVAEVIKRLDEVTRYCGLMQKE
ncbi:hypothetical protein SAMN04487926_101482 [Paraburkholderia steynii]|uniref:Uncharacterized protein n=1 Tax=Paraburkholderia steynii TaxID=1245441 RepID=A0A7Z7B2H0_9BURK|nr:hypothetical protein [Paraburkholderia steynii]SDG97654.1 hypothetical protein SAMN04487926_101482 [Paraburkholderia steynii]